MEMTLTTKEVIEMNNAVLSLSELETLGKNPVKLVLSGANRFKLAKNARTLGKQIDLFEAARSALVEKYGTVVEGTDKHDIDPSHENWEAFKTEGEALLAKEQSLVIYQFSIEDLNLDSNPIPISVLDKLMPLIIET